VEAFPGVTVPSLSKAGRRRASPSTLESARGPSSFATTIGSCFRCGTETGTISASNLPASHRGAGAPVALDGEGVLLLAGDVELPRDELAGVAHVVVVVDVPETVEDHPVEQLSVPEPLPGARLGQVVGRVGHRLHAAGHDDLGVAGPDGLRRERDRLEAGPADLVHRHRGNRHAEAGPDRGLAGRILPAGGLEDLAHQNLVHGLRIHAGAGDRVLDRDGAQVGGLEAGEGALETGDGSAATGDDDGFSHDTDLSGQGDR
jgi:hypothetical protein